MAAVALVIAVRTGRVRARSRVEIRVTVWCPVLIYFSIPWRRSENFPGRDRVRRHVIEKTAFRIIIECWKQLYYIFMNIKIIGSEE
jgi:hypothetical protein